MCRADYQAFCHDRASGPGGGGILAGGPWYVTLGQYIKRADCTTRFAHPPAATPTFVLGTLDDILKLN